MRCANPTDGVNTTTLSDYDTPSHSAWSESSAARPTARGGRRGSEKVAPGAFATLQRRGPQGRAHIWGVCFRAKASKDANGEARRAEPMLWSPTEYRSRSVVVLPCNVHFRAIAYQQTVLPPSRALMCSAIAWKSLKMTDFSKTGSRNMAETRAINFLTPVSYSTSIVIGGLRRLLLAVLMWAGVDLENFRAETARCSFRVFLQIWSLMEQKLNEPEFWFLEH